MFPVCRSCLEPIKELRSSGFQGPVKGIQTVCIGVSIHPTTPFLPSPPLNLQSVQVPLFRQFLAIYWFFVNPPPISQWTTTILKFFILNLIPSFKINQLVKISQFKFFVMTEKNMFFVVKYFRFKFIFCVKPVSPPEKSHPPLSQQPPLKIETLSSPTIENLVGGSTPSCRKGGGVHAM